MTPRPDPADDLSPWLLDPPLAAAWQAQLPACAARWSWFGPAMQQAAARGAAALGVQVAPDPGALSAVFNAWAATLDRERPFESLDPLDFARYACGVLLREFGSSPALPCRRHAAPTPAPEAPAELQRDAGQALQMRLCLTLLDGWHRGLGTTPLVLRRPHATVRHVASCFENLREDASQAPAFIDAMTGAEPNWRLASLVAERPAMRRAAATQGAPR